MLLFISLLKPLSMLLITVSIHLMLLFIEAVRGYCRFAFKVSIHLMLLFIVFSSIHSWTEDLFQYISCCYLSAGLDTSYSAKTQFQYISCCYLSYLPVVKNSGNASFNTSHVVIYQTWLKTGEGEMFMFQYISCCYLSGTST